VRRVAVATCAALPGLDADDRPILAALAARGVEATAAVWDDPAVDWSVFDLTVLRSTWDYAERREAFLAWAESLPWLLNPVETIRWNTDKERYLGDLARQGLPTVPTRFLAPGDPVQLPPAPFVVKPAVSAGGRSSARFCDGQEEAARALVERIHAQGRTAMVQPYLPAAEEAGETALVFIGGRYSHALARRVPLPCGGDRDGLYLEEHVQRREPRAAEREVAEAALAAAPGSERLLYARVDLLPHEGRPLLVELELTEPSLYLSFGAGAVERLADAILAALRRSADAACAARGG
jgi:glutathione synthase/RimK-type ligase-like ATP-grasp enzyme